ncbi:GTP cyclohydrolase II [Ceratobasidium theobromae]|uniref:GTP cyclohydrolase II n=1 Tax=Ceratobasidium theobromae TaxID=1582974 RepID=A0A5N5QS55_9AGAM|nr:GTP cyclohydrolase II [Ceratobasidium theobromae]
MAATTQHTNIVEEADLQLLEALSSPHMTQQTFRRRDAPFDPLLFVAAAASGPHVTRHHYHHDFFPSDDDGDIPVIGSYAGYDNGEPVPRYTSRQKPRRERLRELGVTEDGRAAVGLPEEKPTIHVPPSADPIPVKVIQNPPILASELASKSSSREPVTVTCRARTRIPTPHGPAFLHIYHNNWDSKEHLAIVIDPAQLNQDGQPTPLPPIRSQSLDAVWHEGETEMARIIRGAYVGRLSANSAIPSSAASYTQQTPEGVPAPLIRIHSECFTGETIGSMRCDCGEQLDEAMRLIAQPIQIPSSGQLVPGRGAVVYMRQEGRGIGLLEKIRAYNLQDLGHDTVTANLLLGHGADERGYEIAAAILRDLGLGGEPNEPGARGVRLLTNNPEKMEALEKEKINVEQRVAMVPRSWKVHAHSSRGRSRAGHATERDRNSEDSDDSFDDYQLRRNGATLIGGGAAHGVELERYLATKVQRMGHMLELPSTLNGCDTPSDSGLAFVSRAGSNYDLTKSVLSLPELEFDSASYRSRSVSPTAL